MSDKEVEILLVEDNPADVELTLHALRRNNLANQIRVARDGEEALVFLFDSQHPNHMHLKLLLLDLKLPKVDGLEVLRRLKSEAGTRSIPTVVMTSSTEERDVMESYRLGANSYIVKPVEFDRFEQAVRELGQYWLVLNTPPR